MRAAPSLRVAGAPLGNLDDKGYITRKDRKALIEAAEREPLYPSDFDGANR